ncbi:hypothetical protein [Marinivivus vitaminiproducens]|uniref:hypothetical protein n=1 Tax=Marinivivus vitaminiproducens TaxID=3035935 RepID=UPI00279BA404|nr:hypothetical protein P4R82_23835 [Geminicoccaceae bacterium SCSIO 64248]
MTEAKSTTDHATIRSWIEGRGGCPASVGDTGQGSDVGILRVDFPDRNEPDRLQSVDWDAFFAKFDANKLAFLYQDKTKDGSVSRFNKFVSREGG